jgi:hypothetical protein
MARGPLRKRESYLWTRDPLDWYVEPEWCSERLFAAETFEGTIWDPCAGTGRIRDAAKAAGYPSALASDIEPRGHQGVFSFDFTPYIMALKRERIVDNIVCNPPYKIAREFAEASLAITRCKVAMFLAANWVQGEARSRWLESTPLRRVYFICPRPSCPPGDIIKQGIVPGNGTSDFAWFVWEQGYQGRPEIGWLRRTSYS